MKKTILILGLTMSYRKLFAQEMGLDERIDEAFGWATGWFVNLIFYTIPIAEGVAVPWVLFPLVLGALYFTIRFSFPGVRLFGKAINTVRGKYVEGQDGEVTHFQALTAALSGTVGLGNIAGVAIALSLGGPGATFWMIICGLLGMASKFVECTLGVAYREMDETGKVFGGPMYYLKKGLGERNMGGLGKVLAVLFAMMCIGGSWLRLVIWFGNGNFCRYSNYWRY